MIPFVRELDFQYGRCDRVSPRIRRVIADNPGPFTYLGTGTYIVGEGEVAVIDPGPDLPAHLEALLAALGNERVMHILITHDHADHSPLAAALSAATGAKVWGRSRQPRGQIPAGFDDEHDDAFRPDFEVEDGEVFEGPGWTLEAVPTPGHTSNHVSYALKEENALFSGDHIMGWSTTVISPPDGDMAAYFESLDRVKASGFATLWPTHGPPVTDPQPFIDAYIAHRRAREAQVLAALAEGPTTIRAMVPVLYVAVDPRLHPAAAHSLLGHVVQLVGEGRVISDGPPGVETVLRLA
ncbi:MBL fold metallo-hydrolase [Caulobacter segnis]|uniref:MBL fold metallo-hydrolase n=1 Tax=Caulobacter segnis TaxID=88688 RepID=UPI00240F1985|nr:MBL fold metallo-hydrolase [Caulobacter segnis]MDG2523375.1 MBL fold metallo-hydrolase [Caulobacter segnis]